MKTKLTLTIKKSVIDTGKKEPKPEVFLYQE
ncbi:hypothetical protein BC751_3971 [Cecembia calidifontis]|uniref:Uncharacterized protein n=1 Tax=Cecembia calidifontis TaxID=1187080 RepID=A0A4Q7PD90_9BACT|nr:hypothetical protein BC751_3971 [Cecembia calidifontis]